MGVQIALLLPSSSLCFMGTCWAVGHLEETQPGCGCPCCPRNAIFFTLRPREAMGMVWCFSFWLFNCISISKASSENQYSVFKEVLLLITGFDMSGETGRNQWSMCVHTLQIRELLYYNMEPSLTGTGAGMLEGINIINNLYLQGGFSYWSTKNEL